MRRLYSLLFYSISPWLLFRLWWKGRRLPAYRTRIAERFSLGALPRNPVDVWIHTVSLGEVIAATPLIEALLLENKVCLVTSMTPTGSDRVCQQFGTRVVHRYIPYELPFALKRFFRAYTPRIGIVFETELWPNLFEFARQSQVRLVLFNARLSEKSLRGYRWIRRLMLPVVNQLEGIYAQTKADAQRFERLGAKPARIHTTGSIKFDLHTHHVNQAISEACAQRWGDTRPVLLAASTHEGEESALLARLSTLQAAIPDVLLIIAPRHPERFDGVVQQAIAHDFVTVRRSQWEALTPKTDVLIIDSLGELLGFYRMARFAFVGGSLVSIGGHNVLEPIAMGIPVLTGPFMHNSQSLCDDLVSNQALLQVEDADELVCQVSRLYAYPIEAQALVHRASAMLAANQGALARYLAAVKEIISDYYP